MPKSLGEVKRLSFMNHYGQVQLGEGDVYYTLVWDKENPSRSARLLGPHKSVAQASKAFRKYVSAPSAGKRKQYKRRAKAYASR
jgi:hypothetical protein